MKGTRKTSIRKFALHERVRISAAVAVWLAILTPAMAVDVEPNDTMATAMEAPFSLFFDGIVTQLSIGNGEQGGLDVDMFAIVVPDDWSLPVSLSALAVSDPSGDLMLRLFNANGVELAANDDGNSFQPDIAAIYTLLLLPGTYYLGVSSAENPLYDPSEAGSGRSGPEIAYDLFINGNTAPQKVSPYEPNDTAGNATSMGFGSFTVSDEFIGDGAAGYLDVDIYRITMQAPARLDVLVSGDGWFDPVVRVRSCEDSLPEPTTMDRCSLGSADDGPDGSNSARLSTALFEPGEVFIMVSGSGNRAYDPSVGGSGEPGSVGGYDLSVTVTPLGPSTPNEPNDSIPTATQTPLLIEGRPDSFSIRGFVGDGPYATLRGDRDFYSVRVVDASQLLTVDIETAFIPSDLSPVLIAYDLKGRMLAYADGSATGNEVHLILPAGCMAGAQPSLVLMVMGTRQRLPGDPFDPFDADFLGRVGESRVTDGPGSTGAYRLTVATHVPEPDCALEPNDSAATATQTGLVDEGSYFCADAFWGDSQCHHTNEDVDMWTFQVTQPPVQLRVEAWDCDSFDPFNLHLFDELGNELAFVEGTNGTSGDGTLIVLDAELQEAQSYFLVASSWPDVYFHDIFTPCTCPCPSAEAPYDIAITLSPVRSLSRNSVSAGGPATNGNESRPLFATRLDDDGDKIDLLDPTTGTPVGSVAPPELRMGGTGGMAADQTDFIFYIGQGRFPVFYHVNSLTGEVLAQAFMWVGSGYYTGATMLEDELFLLDHRRRQVHVVHYTGRYVRSLSLGAMHGITIGGGIAGLSGPARLYVADAFNTESIYEIHPVSGAITNVLPPLENRPTALAATDSQLFVADFRTQTLEVRDRQGNSVNDLPLEAPAGLLASLVRRDPFADFDRDGDVDLLDVMAFQNCFRLLNSCHVADSDGNHFIDLRDATHLAPSTTGP